MTLGSQGLYGATGSLSRSRPSPHFPL